MCDVCADAISMPLLRVRARRASVCVAIFPQRQLFQSSGTPSPSKSSKLPPTPIVLTPSELTNLR